MLDDVRTIGTELMDLGAFLKDRENRKDLPTVVEALRSAVYEHPVARLIEDAVRERYLDKFTTHRARQDDCMELIYDMHAAGVELI